MQEKILQGFIAHKSPFSFKNPIFFSCPSNKQAITAKGGLLGSTKQAIKHKRQLFTGVKQAPPEVEEKKVQNFMTQPDKATEKSPNYNLMEKAMKQADVPLKETPIMRLAKSNAPLAPKPKAKT